MKKVIFVIVLCILNLAIIAPRSFDAGRNNIMEAYSFTPGCEMEVATAINRLDKFETGIKLLTIIILITTVILGFVELSKKKEEEPITNVPADDKPKPNTNDASTNNVQPDHAGESTNDIKPAGIQLPGSSYKESVDH